MSAIGPGDWVECVDASGVQELDALVERALYRVRDFGFVAVNDFCCYDGCHEPGLVLDGTSASRRDSYCPARFRPIRRSTEITDLINSLKQPLQAEFLDEAAQVLTPSLG